MPISKGPKANDFEKERVYVNIFALASFSPGFLYATQSIPDPSMRVETRFIQAAHAQVLRHNYPLRVTFTKLGDCRAEVTRGGQ